MHVDCCLSAFEVFASISGVCLFLCFPASDCFLKLLHVGGRSSAWPICRSGSEEENECVPPAAGR